MNVLNIGLFFCWVNNKIYFRIIELEQFASIINMNKINFAQFDRKYQRQSLIGKGKFGKIFKIVNKQTSEVYALKTILSNNREIKSDVYAQIQNLSKFTHPNIVKIFEYYEAPVPNSFFQSRQKIVQFGIIIQLAQCSLHNKIKCGMIYRQQQIWGFAIKFIQLMCWVHSKGLAHRDIKPDNILINGNKLQFKLADFGLSAMQNSQRMREICGTEKYSSPLIKKQFRNPKLKIRVNAFKNDVFSFGITLYELAAGRIILSCQHIDLSHSKQVKSERIRNLLSLALQANEEHRMNFGQILKILTSSNLVSQRILNEHQKQRQIEERQRSKYLQKRYKNEQIYRKEVVQKLQLEDNEGVEQMTIRRRKSSLCQKYEIRKIKGGIQAITAFRDIIMCGMEDGQINFLKGKQVINMGKAHKNFVSLFQFDKNGNIWSAGGDNHIIIWKVEEIMNLINNNVEISELRKSNIFQKNDKEIFQTRNVLNVDLKKIQTIEIPLSHIKEVSCIFCKDNQNYAIGFYNGFIYCLWEGDEISLKVHQDAVTCIKILQHCIFTSGNDGCLKYFNIKQVHKMRQINQMTSPIINFQPVLLQQNLGGKHKGKQKRYSVAMVSLQGKKQQVRCEDGQVTYRDKSELNGILAAKYLNQNYYFLQEEGRFFKNDTEIINLSQHGKGWNCFGFIKNQIIIGSYQGNIAICQC